VGLTNRYRFAILLFFPGLLAASPKLRLSASTVGPVSMAQGANGNPQTVEAFNIGDGSLSLALSSSASYLVTYLPTMGVRQLGLPTSATFIAALVGYAISAVVDPVAGHLSDKYGRVRVMTIGSVGMAVTILPLFQLLTSHRTVLVMVVVMALIAFVKVWYVAPNTAFKAEIFPTRTRGTGLAIGYNVGLTVVGGCTPVIATWLIQVTGTPIAPSFWLLATAIISTASVGYAARYCRRSPVEVTQH